MTTTPLPPLPEPHVLGTETPDGLHYYTSDQMREAVAAERERRHALAADFSEYLYRVQSQVPFDHAEWARQRGEALLAALKT